MNVKVLLEEEIKGNIKALSEISEINSEEYEKATNSTTKLMDRLIEIEKLENDRLDKIASRKEENDLKLRQIDDEKKDRFVKNALTGVSIVGGFVITVWGTIKSIKFEETGTITTIMGRGFINKLLPKK